MKYKVVFKAYKDVNSEMTLAYERDNNCISMHINNKPLEYMNVAELKCMFDDYHQQQQLSGKDYQQRTLFLRLSDGSNELPLDNIIRAFAVTNHVLLYTETLNRDIHKYINTIRDNINKYFYNYTLIDWTGDLGSQPVMYYLKKGFCEQYARQLQDLYCIGLLCINEIEIEGFCAVNYFVPFQIPDVMSIRMIGLKKVWQEIVDSVKDEIATFIKG